MIKVKTFTMNSCNVLHHERLDKVINNWLEENDVEVVDIKYSTCCYTTTSGGSWIPTALLIYKDKQTL